MPGLLKHWDDFYLQAARLYGREEAKRLPELVEQHGITQRQVLCFINYAAGMTQQDIADALEITRQVVTEHIAKVTVKWPHLIPSVPPGHVKNYEPWCHDHQMQHRF